MLATTLERPTLTTPIRPLFRARPAPKDQITFEEYIERERLSDIKHDFVDGVMVPVWGEKEEGTMAGASYEHVVITKNLTVFFENALEGTECQTLGSDMRIEVSNRRLYYYPDLVLLCGDPLITPDECLQNPVLIAEVLSDSTALKDRDEKFQRYRAIESLKHYVLVDQYEPRVEHFARQDNGIWAIVGDYSSLSDVWQITIGGAQISVPLTRVYRRMSFPDANTGMEQDPQ